MAERELDCIDRRKNRPADLDRGPFDSGSRASPTSWRSRLRRSARMERKRAAGEAW